MRRLMLTNLYTLAGRRIRCKNFIEDCNNTQRIRQCLFLNYSTNSSLVPNLDDVFNTSEPKEKMSKAMKAYLERAKEYEEFLKKERYEYQIGKRHLANMMGIDPELFTQNDINKSIEYLFPSGLFEPKARPIMNDPEKLFPPKKAAEFDMSGRPFHWLFYTLKPNYYNILYDIVEKLEKLNNFEDKQLQQGLIPNSSHKFDESNTNWISLDELSQLTIENISEKDYDTFLTVGQRLINHPYSERARDLIMTFRKEKKNMTKRLVIKPLEYDESGRPYIVIKGCRKKTASGEVKLLGDGSGKITINGQDITYFLRTQHREQVSYFNSMKRKLYHTDVLFCE